MSPTLRFLLPLLSALVLLAPAHAARRVALLIGNSQYQYESSLSNPVRDVELLAKTLQGLEFKTEVLKNLPKREMDLAIKRFVRESAGADTALLYYAGHGQQPSKGGRSYLLPVNANTVDDDALEADGILAEDIAAQLERLSSPARLRLIVLDACRNTRAVSRSSVRGLAPPARTDSYTLIAYSTDANSVAQDGQGANSPYAQALAQNLARATREPVRRVFEETAKAVRQATRQQQSPRTYGDLESNVGLDGVQLASLTTEPTGKPVQVQADPEQEAWELAKKRDTVAAYQAYLEMYPKGRYADPARVALKSLQPTPQVAQQPAAPQNQPVAKPTAPPTSTATTQPGQSFKDCADCPEMVTIQAGKFTMGRNSDKESSPPHLVSVKSFAMAKTEITADQWKAVMGKGPRRDLDRDNEPVSFISWDEANAFVNRLNEKVGGGKYRLPSEAEWEYACLAGQETRFCGGNDYDAVAFRSHSGLPGKVAQRAPNAFGLFDMTGNVGEWVADCVPNTYGSKQRGYDGAPTDGSAWIAKNCQGRVMRGGSTLDTADERWSGARSHVVQVVSDLCQVRCGLRIARDVP